MQHLTSLLLLRSLSFSSGKMNLEKVSLSIFKCTHTIFYPPLYHVCVWGPKECYFYFNSRNNGYAISTPTSEQYKGDGIGKFHAISNF